MTIPEATAARQVLKKKIATGEVRLGTASPADQPQQPDQGVLSIRTMIENYQRERNLLKKKDIKTRNREDSGLKKWIEYYGECELAAIDDKMRKDYAIRRLTEAKAAKDAGIKGARSCGGRTIDLDVMALDQAIEWAVTEKWLEHAPLSRRKKLAGAPKEVALLTAEELERLATANHLTPEIVAATPKKYRHLIQRQMTLHPGRAQAFEDYIRLLFYSGGRETETRNQRWENVDWRRKVLTFPGEKAKKGGGRPALEREVDFQPKLENLLNDMYERRDKSSPWLFPGSNNKKPMGSFRAQLAHACKVANLPDVGFHHGRHFFISHCVMAGCNVKAIAFWVSHRDGGALILKKYGKLAPGQPLALLLVEKIKDLGNEEICRYIIYGDTWDWSHAICRIQLKAMARLVDMIYESPIPLYHVKRDVLEKIRLGKFVPRQFLTGSQLTEPSLEDYAHSKQESAQSKESDELPLVLEYINMLSGLRAAPSVCRRSSWL
jgi:integrase